MMEIRVSDFDDSVTCKEIAEELTRARFPLQISKWRRLGGHQVNSIRARYPAVASRKLLAISRVRMGWSSCKIALFPPRDLQCAWRRSCATALQKHDGPIRVLLPLRRHWTSVYGVPVRWNINPRAGYRIGGNGFRLKEAKREKRKT